MMQDMIKKLSLRSKGWKRLTKQWGSLQGFFGRQITRDHSTSVEYEDHSFEQVPFTLCRLKDYVRAVGGESAILQTSLDTFSLAVIKAGADLSADMYHQDTIHQQLQRNTSDPEKASNDVGSIMDDSDSEEVKNIFVEYNGKHVDDLVDDARKKVKAPPKKIPKKTGIWSVKKVDSFKRNLVFSLETTFHYFDRDDYMGHTTNIVEHENSYRKNG
uniref:Probable 2,3-bisphosphoglycerate-independent phosphoglycerate mutase n=1 Tax=Tanacetum cinerariifolium TaxID=118510 RepID=A0A6L2KF70_TANCI|nr:probable 2,3-bisphosphoglycerate-independent phosphoglycerate mutase [Tanacetum cinerariifolium]